MQGGFYPPSWYAKEFGVKNTDPMIRRIVEMGEYERHGILGDTHRIDTHEIKNDDIDESRNSATWKPRQASGEPYPGPSPSRPLPATAKPPPAPASELAASEVEENDDAGGGKSDDDDAGSSSSSSDEGPRKKTARDARKAKKDEAKRALKELRTLRGKIDSEGE